MSCPPDGVSTVLLGRRWFSRRLLTRLDVLDGRTVRLFAGDDWAEDHHDVELMNEAGGVLAKGRLPEGVAGMARLHEMIGRHLGEDAGAEVVIGIETLLCPGGRRATAAGRPPVAVSPS